MPSHIAENLQSGFKLGYGISTDMADRAEKQQFKTELGEATTAGGDFSTLDDYTQYRTKMQAAYNKHGDPATGLQVDQAIGNQMKGKIEDGLKQLRALAQAGTPEAMQQAAALVPKVWSYLPNGTAMQAHYDPATHAVMMRQIDEKTGQPLQGSGSAMTPDYIDKISTNVLESLPDIKAQELAQAKFGEEKRATGVAEGQRDKALDLQGQQVGVAQQQVQATREANRDLADYRQKDLTQRGVEHKDAVIESFYKLAQDAMQFDRTTKLKGRELDQKDLTDQAEIMRNIATADETYMKMFKGSGETWDVKNENAAQNLLSGVIRLDQTANPDGPQTDPVALGRDAWGVMHANNPGDVGANEAVAVVKDIKANPQRYMVQQPDPNSPSGKRGLVQITDRQTGRVILAPQTVTLGLLGAGAAPTPVPNRMPPDAAPPGAGSVGVPERPWVAQRRPQAGANVGY